MTVFIQGHLLCTWQLGRCKRLTLSITGYRNIVRPVRSLAVALNTFSNFDCGCVLDVSRMIATKTNPEEISAGKSGDR
ncbi:hypothetical protein R1flu_021392 [Riccia fluitans]|uniref:Uncharacterized protein n=1 Tax=Riccia fluitans TaxID=41844 RepID=A0ABD1ZP79_9MARC